MQNYFGGGSVALGIVPTPHQLGENLALKRRKKKSAVTCLVVGGDAHGGALVGEVVHLHGFRGGVLLHDVGLHVHHELLGQHRHGLAGQGRPGVGRVGARVDQGPRHPEGAGRQAAAAPQGQGQGQGQSA